MPDDLQRIIDEKSDNKRKERDKLKVKQFEEARKAALQCFSSAEGKIFLRWLCKECGFHAPSSVMDPSSLEINFHATVHNEARRGVYLTIRKMLWSNQEILAEVENNIKRES